MIFTQFTKNALKNGSNWGWGVLFMIFWIIMGAYVFSSGEIPATEIDVTVASYYGIFGLISFSSIAIGFSFVIRYSSKSLPYAFRYSRLKPIVFIRDFLSAFLVVAVIFSAILLVITFAVFSLRFGESLPPYSIPYALLVSSFAGVFLASLDLVLVLFVNNYLGTRNLQFVGFVPLLLTYTSAFPAIFMNVPNAVYYVSPFSAFFALLFSAYSGTWLTGVSPAATLPALNEYVCVLSVSLWTLFLSLASVYLISRIRPRNIEEERAI